MHVPLVFRLALGNVSRCARDYAVYLVTLAFSTCLLYAFNASGDYLTALPLTADQLAVLAKARDVAGAFSVFVVLVFAVLVAYASRFIVRRRSREFGLYALLGMRTPVLTVVLATEGLLAGVGGLAAGLALGVAASPAFGAVAAFVFGVPWRLAWSFSPGAALATCGWFAVIVGVAVVLSIVDVCRRPLVELMGRDRAPERLLLVGRGATRAQAALAVALLAVVWGSCVVQPGLFVLAILPMGWAAYVATSLVFRVVAARVPALARRRASYWEGLRAFTLRQLEGRVSSSCQVLSCACVLMTCAVCMICAGLAFSVGQRVAGGAASEALAEASLAPIGYVGIFYGEAFLVAAAAVLALRQLSQEADARRAYETLLELGADPREVRRSVRVQVGAAFALPALLAAAHDLAGLTLVRQLARGVPDEVFCALAVASLAATLALLGVCYLLVVRGSGLRAEGSLAGGRATPPGAPTPGAPA
ncbi:FtsX-like permease family protein [Olsenella profusa]|uniref:ABC transporter permease n=1 Tax=Olsenella profusa TaxID=138595 RepID=A0ABS2F3H5_9ACTN|nr:FtsX-like permease family protein [Olsenella profusa]MBM6775352.1 ABC transporter permease [Olsenella profusa]